jgi:replicative DNA helicase
MADFSNGKGGGGGSARRSPGSAILDDNLPPQNIEVERSVLGSILQNNEVLHDVVQILDADDFYRDTHQTIYRVIRDLYDGNKPVDLLILSEELHRRDQLEQVGGDDALVEIISSVAHAANATHHADIVRQKSVLRQIIQAANDIRKEGYSDNYSSEQLLAIFEQRVFEIAEAQATGETVELKDILNNAMSRISERAENRHVVSGVGTGYFELDDMTSGFQPTQLIVLAARPSMGKTALALNICEHVALAEKRGVLFVSLEMGETEICERFLCAHSKVDNYKLKTGKGLGHNDMKTLGKSYEVLNKAPIFIDDTPARNVLQITANARRLKRRHNIGLVVVDYIQLIDAEGDGRESRQEQISKISRRLKQLARALEVPVIALSQLNRAVESREDRRPRMADLRESGAIEQDADLVLLLHRPEYYDANEQPGIAEVIIAKNRSGATGTVKLTFLKNFMRFENNANFAEAPIDSGTF